MLVVHQAVHPELAEKLARIGLAALLAQVWTRQKPVLNAADRKWELHEEREGKQEKFSGKTAHIATPCVTEPPPCAKQSLSRGNRSSTPPISTATIAVAVSAGMPTSQGSQ